MKQSNNFDLTNFLVMCFLTIITIAWRIPYITSPILDFHSWRQVDTMAVARNFVNKEFNLFKPTYDDLSSLQSGQENPTGLRLVEFPLYNAIVALSFKLVGLVSIEIWGRIISILFAVVTTIVLYYIGKKESSYFTGIFAGITYAAMPFFVYYTRTTLPESTAVGLSMLALYFLYNFYKNEKGNYISYYLSAIFFALAILVKPTTIFFLLVPFYVLLITFRRKFFTLFTTYIYFLITLLPFIAWRVHISAYPYAIPASDWLITSVNVAGQGMQVIFLKPAFFRWIFFERLNILILGSYLLTPYVMGIFAKTKSYFIQLIGLATLLYIFVFEGGNVQHEYYQVIALPAIALFIGLGVHVILTFKRSISHYIISALVITGIYTFSYLFSDNIVKNYYYHGSDIPSIAKDIQKLTNINDKIVTDTAGDTTVLYNFNRKGAPAIYKTSKELKELGYSYIFTFDSNKAKELEEKDKLAVVFRTNVYTLLKL